MNDGLKDLTANNWDCPDPVMQHFVYLSPDSDTPKVVSGDEWAQVVLAITLSDRVPAEVRRLFAVAQGALVYGYFFYPMFALGAEQLSRVGESAIRHKCLAHDIPIVKEKWDRSLGALLRDLSRAQLLTAEEEVWWASLQKLRNEASHPTEQSVLTPGAAINTLDAVASAVNRLFAEMP